ncbi:haloacid dehalogenase-like hydrolase [Lachnoanaerobaculum saburreum F0468]|jgi:HAD hydrolase, family IA, variant 3|uniref:Haloacid dehalogenase-like hydrolase n=1 Tax=Lachnoanaerobaculum saburreum F0468 TaxID=1095750 RepID=I0R4H3_9FIRM|nr:HAD family phosphatase [Lachnoanaerobaculum saburreum]EIC94581.1 haloacid dehalogenase-like hydrolase [Lachnoanaerobaculum saburreum F0468]
MIKNIKACIFDLDGTLVDSMWMWPEIDKEYLGRFGIEYDDNLKNEIDGISFHETAVYFKNKFGISDSIEKICKDWEDMAYDKYKNEVKEKRGCQKFLEQLKSKGIKMGIATSNKRSMVDVVLESLGMKNFFDVITTSDEVKKGKPAPDVYLTTANLLNVEPKHCLVFEDVVAGIIAGKSAGMKVCAVEDDFTREVRQRKKELSDYYIDDYSELL